MPTKWICWIAMFIPPVMAAAAAQETTTEEKSTYAWADTCKECHEGIYQAWAKTKHKTSTRRLAAGERQGACVGCHVTGSELIIEEGEEINSGVQCEACHGPAKAHADGASEAPPATEGLEKPAEERCKECHNKNSPHYKEFNYKLLVRFVHMTN